MFYQFVHMTTLLFIQEASTSRILQIFYHKTIGVLKDDPVSVSPGLGLSCFTL